MDDLGYIVDKMLNVAKNDTKDKTKPYDAVGTVKRIDGDTAWVHFDNGVNETPVAKSINCKIGDKVHVRISNGNAFIVGNETAPPTDDTKAEHAQITATVAEKEAEQAKGLAQDASDTADRTAQYFWYRNGTDSEAGAHVTEIPQEDFEANPSGGNLIMRTGGIAVRDGTDELASFTGGSAQIGRDDTARTIIEPEKISMVTGDGAEAFSVDSSASSQTTQTKVVSVAKYVAPSKSVSISALDGLANGTSFTMYATLVERGAANTVFVKGTASTGTGYGANLSYNGGNTFTNTLPSSDYRDYMLYRFEYETTIYTPITTVSGRLDASGGDASGVSINADGGVIAEGHSSVIGTLETNSDSATLSTATEAEVVSLELSKGSWIVMFGAQFTANSSGRRTIKLRQASTDISGAQITVTSGMSGTNVFLSSCCPIVITSATNYVRLRAEQNSGSQLSCSGYIRAMRIA